MKKLNFLILTAILVIATFLTSMGQSPRVVVVPGWDPAAGGAADDFNNLLYDAIDADSTGRKENPNTIYELKRDHLYPQGKVIKNYDYHLHLRAEEGEGLNPEFIVGKKTDGSYGNDYIQSYNDLTIENISFNAYTPDGKYLNRMIEISGNNSRVIYDGVVFDGDRGSCVCMKADSLKVYVYNVKGVNSGHRKTTGGNGRLIDLRPEAIYVDTLIVKNTTTTNTSDRIIRNMGSIVNYFEYDHVTALNVIGYHGGLQLGNVKTAIVTNSVFGNIISLGHVDSRTQEQTQPEPHFAVITLDTVFAGQHIEIRNNNIYFDQEIKDIWAKFDSVSAPWEITPTIEAVLGADASKAWFSEPLVFEQSCSNVAAYVNAYYSDPAASEFPENWCVGGDGGYFADELNVAYANSYTSFTAGDKGFPVGDLNNYKELYDLWKAGGQAVSVQDFNELANNFSCYPNPVSKTSTISYSIPEAGYVELSVLDMTGKTIQKLKNSFQEDGDYQITFDASSLNQGIYFIKLNTQNGSAIEKVTVTK